MIEEYLSEQHLGAWRTFLKAHTKIIDLIERDLMAALDQGVIEWIDVAELGRVVAMRSPGRQSAEDITLFKSLGIALEDIAVAMKVYQKAKEAGVGRWLEL